MDIINALLPVQASNFAAKVDTLCFFLVGVTAFFATLVVTLVVIFAVKFRRKHEHEVGAPVHGALMLELTWTFIPLVVAMVIFAWGASVFFAMSKPPSNAMEIYAIGKRWMWKFQHVTGQREINELHIPTGQPIKILIGSEDVLHSVYIPAFRTKMDAIPGRTTTMWFTPTRPGRYHLFCAEYCGTRHSGMIGSIVVMDPREFEVWLAGGPAATNMAAAGAQLFSDLACVTCHRDDGQGRGPALQGVFGSPVLLQTGQTVTADDAYVRESILNPQAKIVQGYPPLMPTFQGMVSEEQLNQLIAYVKSLAAARPPGQPSGAPQGQPSAPAPGPQSAPAPGPPSGQTPQTPGR
jgi:cytochrome c oxidase subunit 2